MASLLTDAIALPQKSKTTSYTKYVLKNSLSPQKHGTMNI